MRSRPPPHTPTGRAPRLLPDPDRAGGQDQLADHGRSFILLHAKADKPQNAVEVMKFFDWAMKHGQKMAAELDYVPMPDNVIKMINDDWRAQVKDASGKALWN